MQPEIRTQTIVSTEHSNRDWRVWWRLTRPHTLTAGFVPVLIGTALALDEKSLHWGLFAAMLITSLFLQIATNLFNEYYDFKRGLDNEHSVGIGGSIVRDGFKPSSIMRIAMILYGLSVLLGIYICLNSSWLLVIIGIIGMAVGYFYTGGPYPISSTPFGELMAGFFMGVLLIIISYFVQTGHVTGQAWLVSIPIGLLVGNIMLSNNIRDLDGDKENGRKTLAILVGRKRAIFILGFIFSLSFIWTLMLSIAGFTSYWTLLAFLSIPKAVSATKGFIGKSSAPEMMPAMKATGQTNTFFGLLFSIGMFIGFFV